VAAHFQRAATKEPSHDLHGRKQEGLPAAASQGRQGVEIEQITWFDAGTPTAA